MTKPDTCNPACLLDPGFTPSVMNPLWSPIQKLEWACAEIGKLNGRVDDLERRVAALENKS